MSDHRRAAMPSPPGRALGRRQLWRVMVLLSVICGFALYRSSVLRFAAAEVNGNARLSPERVVEAAGLTPGAPRWLNSARDLQWRLRQEPWIKSASVQWNWNRVQISVTERTPVALLPYQGRWVALDATGMILELVLSPAGHGLPVVSGVTTLKALRGQQLTHPGLSDALLLLSWMAEPIRSQVSEVGIEPDRALTLYMVGGAQVEWGYVPEEEQQRTGATKQKIELLYTIWQRLGARGAGCQIDMRIDGRGLPSGCG